MALCILSWQISPAEAQVLTQLPSFLSENIRERSWGIEPRSRLRHLLLQDTRDISARHWVRAQKPHFSLSRTSSANTVGMQINPKSEQSYERKTVSQRRKTGNIRNNAAARTTENMHYAMQEGSQRCCSHPTVEADKSSSS